MQDTVPQLLDISGEPQHVLDAYGVKPGPEGSFARQCLMARRLSEAGVRFVEIRQAGWDHHTNLHQGLIDQTRMVDQPTAALLADLKKNHKEVADRVVGSISVDEHHLTEDQLLAKARDMFVLVK